MPAALNKEAGDKEKAADAGNKLAHTPIHNSVQILADSTPGGLHASLEALRFHPTSERLRVNRARHEE